MRAQFFALVMCALTPFNLGAQAETFADIRQDLSKLRGDLQALNAELQTTRSAWELPDGAVIDRVNQIEAKLQSLTQSMEQLEFRIAQMGASHDAQLDALEVRLCTLDPACDGQGTVSGTPSDVLQSGVVMTVTEQREFDSAKAMLDGGDPASAVDMFQDFTQAYPGGPITQQAFLLMGQAHVELDAHKDAARAFLNAYSADPKSVLAADALFRLSLSFNMLGQVREACVTLAEVEFRFPSSAAATAALTAMADLGCE